VNARIPLIVALATFIGMSLCAQTPDGVPKLAIINKHHDPAAADLVFSKLAASGAFILVERDQLAQILREQALSSFSRENNVRTGQLAGADALLFVEPDRSLLHLRLVETQHGERVFDIAFDPRQPDFPAMIETVKARLATVARKLRTPRGDRLYLALGPIVAFRKTNAFAGALAALSAQIGIRLGQNDRVIVLERDALADVVAEKDLTGTDAGELSGADALVRGRLVEASALQFNLEFRVQLAHAARNVTFSVKVDRTKIEDGAATIAAKVGEALALKSPAPDGSLDSEARQHYLSGLALLHAQSFEPALRELETACLLDRRSEKHARTFLEGVAWCILERVGGSVLRGRTVPAAEYAFLVDRLLAAMLVARNHVPPVSGALAEGRRVCSFLAVKNERLDDDERALVAACRLELREFFERYCADANTAKSTRRLGDYAPLFFEEPRAALEYLKRILAAGGYPWSSLREHVFPRIEYWDKELALKLWNELLDEVERDPSPEKQFSAIASRCFYDEVFPSAYSQGVRGKGRASAQRLFAWLAAREENLQWVLTHENWYIFLRIWNAMYSLPIEEQNRYFETVMLKVFEVAHGSEYLAFSYLRSRCGRDAQDHAQVRKLLDKTLACLAGTNPKLHRQQLEEIAADEWLSKLMGNTAISGTPMPDIPGGVLLYNSHQTKLPKQSFDHFHGLQDGPVLWLANTNSKALVVTRVEMARRTSETHEFPVEASRQSAFEQLVLARSPRFLVVADQYRVLAIPVSEKPPCFNASDYQIIGPKFGADDTGGSFERMIRAGGESDYCRVTAVIPCGDALYIGLDQSGDHYGAIYRWQPDARDCELICASHSLKSGPLNDCLPYSLAGGCAAGDGKAVYFFLTHVPGQPATFAEGQRQGAWKFTPASGQWEQLSNGRQRPMSVSDTIFDIPAESGNDRFNVQTMEIRHAAGGVSGAEEGHGWEAKSEKVSGVHYERLYRVDGKKRTRLFSLSGREFEIGALIPTDQGLVILIPCLLPDGNKPTARGVVYLLPQER